MDMTKSKKLFPNVANLYNQLQKSELYIIYSLFFGLKENLFAYPLLHL